MILESVMSDHPTIRLPLPETIEASLPREPWLSPVVWLQLEQGRLSGLPVIERSSGFPNLDSALMNALLATDFPLGISSGYYRLHWLIGAERAGAL
jgi:hypothetical protein